MSSLNLAKKFKPARKAWKSFSNTLQSRLGKLTIAKAIAKLSPTITLRRIRPFIQRILRKLPPIRHRSSLQHCYHTHRQLQNDFSAIYVEELFPKPASASTKHVIHPLGEASKAEAEAEATAASTSTGANEPTPTDTTTIINMKKQKQKQQHSLPPKNNKAGEISGTCSLDKAWKAAVSSLPQLRGVDERAEDFISKFREEIRLQKEQSILDFQEMLARGA